MTLEEFKQVTAKLNGHSGRLAISCEFEPLLHPDIEFILRECATLSNNWNIRLNTNAILLTENISSALIESRIQEIYVSIDAPTQEMNFKIRGNKALPKIIEELKKLSHMKHKSGKKAPICIIRSTAMRANLQQLPDMITLASEVKAQKFSVKHLLPIAGCEWDGRSMTEQSCLLIPEETESVFSIIRERGKILNIEVDLPPTSPKPETELRASCSYVTNGFHIFPNGTIYPCVWLTINTNYGNIFHDSFETIIHSRERASFQNAFTFPKIPTKCLACIKDSQTVGLKIEDDPMIRLQAKAL